MPLSTGATWPALKANFTAAAADMTAKFEWAEGHRYPMSGGQLTDSAFDIGSSIYKWNSIYCKEINAPELVFFNVNNGCSLRAWGRIDYSGGTITTLQSNGISAISYDPLYPGQYSILVDNWTLTAAEDQMNYSINYFPVYSVCAVNDSLIRFYTGYFSHYPRSANHLGNPTVSSFSIIICGRILYQG